MTVSADKLAEWRSDIVTWAEENVHVRHPETGQVQPLRLYRHQRNWLAKTTRRGKDGRFVYKVACCSWPKRDGKSLCASLVIA